MLKDNLQNDRGSALLTVIIIMSIVFMMGAILLNYSLRTVYTVREVDDYTKAESSSEEGVYEAIVKICENIDSEGGISDGAEVTIDSDYLTEAILDDILIAASYDENEYLASGSVKTYKIKRSGSGNGVVEEEEVQSGPISCEIAISSDRGSGFGNSIIGNDFITDPQNDGSLIISYAPTFERQIMINIDYGYQLKIDSEITIGSNEETYTLAAISSAIWDNLNNQILFSHYSAWNYFNNDYRNIVNDDINRLENSTSYDWEADFITYARSITDDITSTMEEIIYIHHFVRSVYHMRRNYTIVKDNFSLENQGGNGSLRGSAIFAVENTDSYGSSLGVSSGVGSSGVSTSFSYNFSIGEKGWKVSTETLIVVGSRDDEYYLSDISKIIGDDLSTYDMENYPEAWQAIKVRMKSELNSAISSFQQTPETEQFFIYANSVYENENATMLDVLHVYNTIKILSKMTMNNFTINYDSFHQVENELGPINITNIAINATGKYEDYLLNNKVLVDITSEANGDYYTVTVRQCRE